MATAFDHATHATGRPSSVYGTVIALQFAALVALIIAAAQDAITEAQRDWLHWFSIGVTFVAFLGNSMIEFMAAYNNTT